MRRGTPATANDTAALDTSAGITVSLADVNAANAAAAPISGTTTGIEPGRTVTLVVSDADPATPDVTVTAVINPDGSYSTTADLVRLDGRPAERDRVGHADAAGNAATANDTARAGYERRHHGEPGRRECGERRGRADRWHDDRHRAGTDGDAGGQRCRSGDAGRDRHGDHQPRRQLQHDGQTSPA
ncbi:hypothetical protein MASR2M50_04340 [Thauera sp.]